VVQGGACGDENEDVQDRFEANDVDTLATGLYATTDDVLKEHPDLAPWHPPVGITPLVIDDTQAQKKGTKSAGVAFQHCGLTSDVRDCQTMVMLTHATADRHAFIDRRLYLPEE
jgi:SRSO17 transposase